MSLPLNKTVPLTHLGAGIITFPVPCLSAKAPETLRLQMQTSMPQQSNQTLETPLWLDLLKIGGNLRNILKKNGSFYIGLLQEGFLQNGAITLIGWTSANKNPSSQTPTESENIFKTVMQMDGDMICQIDHRVLKNQQADALIQGYASVQDAFFEGFNKILRTIRLLIITSLSVLIPVLYFIWKFFQ